MGELIVELCCGKLVIYRTIDKTRQLTSHQSKVAVTGPHKPLFQRSPVVVQLDMSGMQDMEEKCSAKTEDAIYIA